MAAWFLGCTTATSVSRRTLFTTTPTVPQGFAGNTGMNIAARALLASPKEAEDNSTAYAFLQFEGGGMLRLPDDRTSLGVRVNLASTVAGVAQPSDRLSVLPGAVAGEVELQAAHDIPFQKHVGLTAAVSAGLVFSRLLVMSGSGVIDGVEAAPHLAGGLGVYGSVAGFRPYVALTLGTQVLNSSTGSFSCTLGYCEDTGTVRIGALLMASTGARYSWGAGAVEVGVVIPLTQDGQRLPVMLAFTGYLGDFLIKPSPKRASSPEPVPPQPPPPPSEYAPL